jgi:anti-sigma B factor antagonist
MSDFAVSVLQADADVVWLSFSGEFDVSAVERASRALAEAEALSPESILVDLSLLSFMDSSGLHWIVEAHESAQRHGVRVSLIAGPPTVQRLFAITGLEEHLVFVARPLSPPVSWAHEGG